MMYENRIKHLKEAHRMLDVKVDSMSSTSHFIDEELVQLKKQRLTLADEIARMQRLQTSKIDTIKE